MNPFTLFLGRLVEHLGAEIAINLVREFAGKTIQFPITCDYTGSNDTSTARNQFGFSSNAPVIGAEYVRPPKDRTTQPLQTEPHRLSVPASAVSSEQVLKLAHQLAGLLPALQRLSTQVELTHLAARAAIESQSANPVQT